MRKLLLISVITFYFVACKNLPNERIAEKTIINSISEISNQNVELIEFKKINAQEQNIFGVEIYEIEFDGKIRYKKSGFINEYSVKSHGLNDNNFLIIKDDINNRLKDNYTEVKQNDEINITGKIKFEKKENGWSEKKPLIKIKK